MLPDLVTLLSVRPLSDVLVGSAAVSNCLESDECEVHRCLSAEIGERCYQSQQAFELG